MMLDMPNSSDTPSKIEPIREGDRRGVGAMNFQWAVDQMAAGKKVRRESWDRGLAQFWYKDGEDIREVAAGIDGTGTPYGTVVTWGDLIAQDWALYDERPDLSTLEGRVKALMEGRKFRHKTWDPNLFIRVHVWSVVLVRRPCNDQHSYPLDRDFLDSPDWEYFDE